MSVPFDIMGDLSIDLQTQNWQACLRWGDQLRTEPLSRTDRGQNLQRQIVHGNAAGGLAPAMKLNRFAHGTASRILKLDRCSLSLGHPNQIVARRHVPMKSRLEAPFVIGLRLIPPVGSV